MKVLQLSKYYEPVKGGIELVAREMTKAHLGGGDKVSIIAFSKNDEKVKGTLGESIWRIKQDIFLLSTPMNYNFLFSFKEYLLKEKFDRIYVHLPNPFMHEMIRLTREITKACGSQIIGVYHSDILNKGILGPLYLNYFLHSENLYDDFICSSENLRASSLVLSQVLASKVHVIPFCMEEKQTQAPLLKGQGQFLSIGRMVPYKGFEFLIRTFNQTPYKLTLVGRGPLYDQLRGIAGPNITFAGEASEEEKLELMRQSDALIVSSNSAAEAYGMTIVEAFHMGLPVIASRIKTGVTFLVRHGATGLLFDINHQEQLKENLATFAFSPETLRSYSQRGKEFYQNEIRFELFQKKLLNLELKVDKR